MWCLRMKRERVAGFLRILYVARRRGCPSAGGSVSIVQTQQQRPLAHALNSNQRMGHRHRSSLYGIAIVSDRSEKE